MPIYITVEESREAGGVAEWAIVELQGLVHAKDGEDIHGHVAGDLHYVEKSKQPVLVLGHHVLHGKQTRLEPALAVVERLTDHTGTRYNLRALVKKKLVFKTRPKPIISNVAERV